MRTLAVTGGIGSGKSYVVQMLAAMGVPVYDADSRAKGLYATDTELLAGLKEILGDRLLRNGVLDREYMASRIFSDRKLLEEVEKAVFPRVIADFRRWKAEQEAALDGIQDAAGFVIIEGNGGQGPHRDMSGGGEGGEGHAALGHDPRPGPGTDGQPVER